MPRETENSVSSIELFLIELLSYSTIELLSVISHKK